MQRYLRLLPVQLLGAIAAAFFLNMVVCSTTVRVFFTISSVIKEVLEFFLPTIVFFFVASGVASFAANSVVMVVLLLGLVTLSNALTGLYAYSIGTWVMGFFSQKYAGLSLDVGDSALSPFVYLKLPALLSADVAMIAALIIGCMLTVTSLPLVSSFIATGKRVVERALSILFIPILPLYVFGFFLKMMRELPIGTLASVYGSVFLLVIALQVIWLYVAYCVANIGSLSRILPTFMTASPSYLTALGTMSSIATLPVSLVCAEKNTGNKQLVHFAMPILANIHLMGDAVCVPLFALATMKLFLGVVPSFGMYIIFLGYFCVAMLAVSGIPGGGIIVMLPLLKTLFGFTPEMLSVITALYLLQDGFGTAANVMGDGALVIVLDRISNMFTTKKKRDVYGAARSSK